MTNMEKALREVDYVESLITTIIFWTRGIRHIDIDRLKEILIELEKIRIDLEYRGYACRL